MQKKRVFLADIPTLHAAAFRIPHFDVDPDPPFRNSGSGFGSSDPQLEKVGPDPVPKWTRIRIRVPIFHKEIHVGQITILIFVTAKI